MIQFSNHLQNAIDVAKAIAKEYYNKAYSPAHLLKGLLHKDSGLNDFFNSIGADVYYIEEWCDVRIESLPKVASIPHKIEGDNNVEAVWNEAQNLMLKIGGNNLNETAALIALSTPGVGFTYEQLKSLPLQANEILNAVTSNSTSKVLKKSVGSGKSADTSILDQYCINKKEQAIEGTLQKIFGRDGEIKMIIEILGRYSKPNVLILGESGVGKSVLLDGFVNAIEVSNVPENLANATVYELDLVTLVSGASYKSEVEDRLKKIFSALKTFEKPILLIDDISDITEKENNNQGLINIVKAELSKGGVTIIATATNDAYRKHIEIHQGLSRNFEIINLLEPSEEDALTMISNTIDYYTDFHNLKIDDTSIAEAIRLAKRFSKDRSLPDAAIDLLDRTMSAIRYMLSTTISNIDSLKEIIEEERSNENSQNKLSELRWQWFNLKNKFSYLLFSELDEEINFDDVDTVEKAIEKIESVLDRFKEIKESKKEEVTKSDISATIANKTGIPVGKLQTDEKERLLAMESVLQQRVIGQDHAVKTITDAILESRSGLSKAGLPVGSFFFTGPTGTGKTELAKSLAEFMFQTEEAIIRFDMSEFKEEHSAALLYGAPPGYVGYEEGGVLVNKIREKPYSIVLFDEIEKAHPSVFDIFLQILDEGKLSDRLGKVGDFSNAVILFTSNIGSNKVIDSFNQGIVPESSDLMEIMGNYFRPEFLGRLTEIVPFAPISIDNVVKIFNIQMKDLNKSLERQGITLNLSENAKEHLAKKGFTPKYGARPLRGVIRTELRSPLSKKIIIGEISKGSIINLDFKKEKLHWEFK
ncbi:ATP-dependent Clp protease ATP-binding subunit [Aquimarina agarivorans]|uniref:ATP-dependent Clp protease ATP-binding subunit n=1 Tax=Aquimarina agarivorans TaxID=980584 RepID=UPI000248E5E0|nr:ATP-dependent Clp protease ATP-binding subunit [Aquimarina agarivorans]